MTTDDLIKNAINRAKSAYSMVNKVATASNLTWRDLYSARDFLKVAREPAQALLTAMDNNASNPVVDIPAKFNEQMMKEIDVLSIFTDVETKAIVYYQKLEALFNASNTREATGTGLTFEVNDKVYDSAELTDVKSASLDLAIALQDFA